MSLRAILFDLDGTLIATRRLYVEAFARALEPHVGRRLSEEEIIDLKPRAEIRFLSELAGAAGADVCLDAFYRHYEHLHETHFEGVYRGIPPVLDALRERGLPLGLVTGKSRRSWEITCCHVELGPFDVEVLDDDVPRQKPDPAGLRQAVEALGVEPGEAIYVGDSLTDAEAARTAGLRAGAVLWCKKEEEKEAFREAAVELGAEIFPEPRALLRPAPALRP